MIRLATEADARGMLDIYAPIVNTTAISFELSPPCESEMQARIRNTLASHAWLVAEEEGFIAGYAYSGRFRAREAYAWTVEVTVYVHPAWQHRGLASALYKSLFAVLRLQGFCTAVAIIALPNEPSVSLHEKLGFEPAGVIDKAGYKFGRWHDIGSWQLELQLHPAEPSLPRPMSELIADGKFP